MSIKGYINEYHKKFFEIYHESKEIEDFKEVFKKVYKELESKKVIKINLKLEIEYAEKNLLNYE